MLGQLPPGLRRAFEVRHPSARLREWNRTYDVYAYFNNDWEGFAPRNARDLKQLLATS